jgi:ABC-type branched-subunit amino acid transport system substrate-binding protein
MHHHSRIVGAAACAAALVLAACGGGDDGDDGGTAVTAGPITTAPGTLSDEALRIGTLLPETGSQADLGPAMAAAAELAVKDVNDAGGVIGKPVELVPGDSGDASTDVAAATMDELEEARVDAIVGPASSGVAGLVIDRIGAADMVLVSPANPLAAPPEGTRYFKTAPGDDLRGRAVADQLMAAKATNVAVVSREDPYGDRLAKATTEALQAAKVSVTPVTYNSETEVFGPVADEIVAADPDAIVLAGYTEIAQIVASLATKGLPPDTVPTWLLPDRLDNVGERVADGALEGAKGVVAGVEPDPKFLERLRTIDPAVADTTYAAETYDAVVLVALAVQSGRSDSPATISATLPPVTQGTQACKVVAECMAALAESRRIAYEGVAGGYRLNGEGSPTTGSFVVATMGADNAPDASLVTYVRATSS